MASSEADILNFRQRVELLVSHIPQGRVMTYGQLAALCGSARAARIVGGIAHFGDPKLPWHRVVNKQGGLASGYPGDRPGHRAVLEAEGYTVSDEYRVNVSELLWRPEGTELTQTLFKV
ncbi:MGMT family protein [Aeromicrobium sp.]|nr:MGMT family protein [Candidatus Saccharibacteria bacterium]